MTKSNIRQRNGRTRCYGKENEIDTDVLVIGGGIAGCHAAISAVKKGARLSSLIKTVIRSGLGGAGVITGMRFY